MRRDVLDLAMGAMRVGCQNSGRPREMSRFCSGTEFGRSDGSLQAPPAVTIEFAHPTRALREWPISRLVFGQSTVSAEGVLSAAFRAALGRRRLFSCLKRAGFLDLPLARHVRHRRLSRSTHQMAFPVDVWRVPGAGRYEPSRLLILLRRRRARRRGPRPRPLRSFVRRRARRRLLL